MTRHGKNCTAGAVYSYHERKKDTAASGYGTQRVRVGRDAIKDFDCCCLSLQPCRDPVVTPDGFLYQKHLKTSPKIPQNFTKISPKQPQNLPQDPKISLALPKKN
ncbi:nitric oxide synthase-interacting protein isoform X2 [Melospiza melodia melodia]|uniref:nitric oxide synthase-interacting protein isoform X2 n=1 Tax=Melospiza melodia melodia TaxID=1914991 RepID=UPI002FD4A209